MCVNINNVNPQDMEKLSVLLNDLRTQEGESALGALLGFMTVMIMAGEDIHLADPESMEELARRSQENIERIRNGEQPKTDRDWAAEAMGMSPEQLEQAIQEAAQSIQNGVVPPGAYTPPQSGGHNTIQPIPKPDEGDEFRPGMYL